MNCDNVRTLLTLLLYGELSFDDEEVIETHLDTCEACRAALVAEKALHRALDEFELTPPAELLAECRRTLRGSILSQPVSRHNMWERFRSFFAGVIRPMPASLQPVAALALLAIGFFGSRFVPREFEAAPTSAGLLEPSISRVRYVEPVSNGRVQIIVDETRQHVLTGALEDQKIQHMLLAAAKDPSDPGLRVESVDLLKNQSASADVRQALLYALQHDNNAGVRLKALDGLKSFADDPETRTILTQALLTDKNPGVRTQIIDLLVQHKNDNMVGTLQQLMRVEDNSYVRMRCERVLHDMNASIETF